MLKRITQSPYLNLLSGLILLASSGYEVFITANQAVVGVSHGILMFSIIHVFRVIPDIMHGLTEIEEAEELTSH